jgi:pimeloyl-ACP methyl ester carboxylesterase
MFPFKAATMAAALACVANAQTPVSFPSEDGLICTADLYLAKPDKKTPFIVLFHQAGKSRGEYQEIAPRLNQLGFNCLAVDARSGSSTMGVQNETALTAMKAGKPIGYQDALPDLLAALAFARKTYAEGKLIAWGSSYSASLSLHIAGLHPERLDGVLAFSPGEYFSSGTPLSSIAESSTRITGLPVFITSGTSERSQWEEIFNAIPSPAKTAFLPAGTARSHGSAVLWGNLGPAYWEAVEAFLKRHFLG